MKQFYLTKNSIQFGPYPEDEVVNLVSSGEFDKTDLCWIEGMDEWKPIYTLVPQIPPPVPAKAVPTQEQSSESNKLKDAWFLYIPITRLVIMVIVTSGIYYSYWVYKNWQYLKTRDGLNIWPFIRGILCVFYTYPLLRAIKKDATLNSVASARFPAGWLTVGFIFMLLISNTFDKRGQEFLSIFTLMATFLPLLPPQLYINKINFMRSTNIENTPWTTGHITVLVIGCLCTVLILGTIPF